MAEKKQSLKSISLKVLVVNGSNRQKSNSAILTEKAIEELKKYENTEIRSLEFYNKNYGRYDNRKDIDEWIENWEWADTIIFLLPNYTVGGPGTFYEALERLSEVSELKIREGIYEKTAGVLMQGSAQYGMVELALESTFQMLAGLHVIPVYRLPAHIPDGTKPGEELFGHVEQMVEETVLGGKLYKLSISKEPEESARILVVNVGMEDGEIAEALEKRIVKALGNKKGINPEVFRFEKEKFRDCHHCNVLCRKTLRCAFKDGFQEFFDKWIRSDGIIWITSANQCGVPAEVHLAHDRLSETGFSTVSDRANRLRVPYRFCRYTKPEGVVAYGRNGYGGQTQAQQFFVNVAEQRGNYFISGRTPSSLGPAALLRQESQLGCDRQFTQNVDNLTEDIAKIARGIQTAKKELYDDLPELFYNSRTQMGVPDKEGYFND